jgi:hypothetical protein
VQLSNLLKQLLTKAGIDWKYPAYSIRHALITALFDAGLSDSQVSACMSNSNNAHAASTSYFHLNSEWIGHAIAASPLSPAGKRGVPGRVDGGIWGGRSGRTWSTKASILDHPLIFIVILFFLLFFFFSSLPSRGAMDEGRRR